MDDQLLNQLYERYSREIYLYLYSLSRDPELSEDLMQDTFLKALLSLPDQHTNMRAWLYRVARNCYFDHQKKADSRKTRPGLDEHVPVPGQKQRDPLSQLILSEQKRTLYSVLSRMEPRKREILVLQYYSGLSQKEIAGLMHLSLENVRVLAYRGKRELKKLLEEDHYEIS